MSLQRIIELQLNANGVARGLKDIQNQLRGIDTAIDGVNSNPLDLGAGTGSGGAQNAPIQRARRSLMDYEGQLSNVQRTITQTIGVQSRSEAAMLKYDTVTRKLNKSLAEGRLSQSEYNEALVQANRAYSTASQRAAEYDNQLNRMVDSSGKTRGAFDAMRGGAANFSYQLQDVIVQMQMGTAFGTIIAQQGPQIASIFGAGGAALGVVIALAGALGGVLLNNLNDSADAMGDLTKQAEKMSDAFESIDGVVQFTNDLQELIKQSESLADLKIQTQLAEIAQSASNLRDALAQGVEGAGGSSWIFFDAINLDALEESFNAIAKAGLEVNNVLSNTMTREERQRLGEYLGSLYPLNSNLRAIQESFNLTRNDAVSFVDSMMSLNDTSNLTTEQLDEMAGSFRTMIGAAIDSSNTTEEQRKRLVALSKSMFEFVTNAREVVQVQEEMIGRNVSAFAMPFSDAALNALRLNEGLSGSSDLLLSINDEFQRLNDLQLAVNDAGFGSRAYQAAQENAITMLSEYLFDLSEQADLQAEINDLRQQGLNISEAQAQAAINAAQSDMVGDLLADTDAADISLLTAQIELLQSRAQEYANDASFQESLQSLQDELIESTQGAYALEDASNAVNEAMRFQGADAAIAVLDDMRAMALLTTEQYEDMRREITQGQTDMAQSARDFATELDQEIAAINAGTQALRDYNDEMAARRALGISTVRDLSDAETEAVDLYIQKTRERERAEAGTMESFLGNMDDAAGSFAQLADAVGKGSEEMKVVLAAVAAAQAVNAVLNQASGDPYTAFARMASMAATVAQLGVALGGLSGAGNIAADRQASQGAGTVLGDVAAKSESIANATEYAADALEDLVGINSGMLTELRNLNNAMSGASNLIARDVNFSGIAGGLGLSSEASIVESLSADAGALFDSLFLGLTGNLFEGLLGGIGGFIGGGLFGSSSVRDDGIRILGGTISEVIENDMVQAYQTVEKSSWFSSSTSDHYRAVSSAVETQFDLVFQSLFNTVESAVLGLGFDSTSVQERLNSFVVETMRISLRDLSPEEQLEEINAVFSKTFDQLAAFVAPALLQFQQAGEGMGETLSRVSTNFQVVNEAINQLNLRALTGATETVLQASEGLVELFGGAGELASAFTGFVDTFTTEERQLEILTEGLTRALGEQDSAILRNRDGVYEYIQALDISNESEARRLANILNLTDSMEEFFDLVDSVLQGNTDTAFSVLSRSISAERQRLTDAYEDNVDAINKSTEGFKDVISGLTGLSNSLEQAIGSSRVNTQELNFARLQASRVALARAAMNGSVPTDGSLDRFITEVSGDNEQFYSDFESYAIAQAAQANDLKQLKELADDQLDEVKSAEEYAQEQIELLGKQHNESLEALDAQLQTAQEQLDIARGTNVAVTDIATAMGSFLGALRTELGVPVSSGGGSTSGSSYTSSQIRGEFDRIAMENTANGVTNVDSTYLAAGVAAINAGVSSSQLADALGVSQDRVLAEAERLGLPAFASGGFHSGGMRLVGERGAEMELTGPSRIFSANQTSDIIGGAMVGSAEVLAELKYTNQLLRDLNVKMIESNDNTDLLETFAINGLAVNATIVADQTV